MAIMEENEKGDRGRRGERMIKVLKKYGWIRNYVTWVNTIHTSITLIKIVMGKRPTCLLAVPVHSCKASITLDSPVL